MRIEIKALKVMASLSEETACYTAMIYVDGVKAFAASNHGTGGPDFYQPVKGYAGPSEAEIDAWLAANVPPLDCSDIGLEPMAMTLELFVGKLIEETETRKAFDRKLRAKVLTFEDGALMQWKAKPEPRAFDAIAKRLKPGAFIVQTASEADRARAFEAFKGSAA